MSSEKCTTCGRIVTFEDTIERPGGAMSSRFLDAVKHTLDAEGFFADDRLDPGGKTIYGFASNRNPKAYADIYATYETDGREAAKDRAIHWYYELFWKPNMLDGLESAFVAYEIFDTAVNCGPVVAVKCAQKACNALGKLETPLEVDGWMGELTDAALDTLSRKYEMQLVTAMNLFQGQHYLTLLLEKPEQFGWAFAGWMRRLAVPPELLAKAGIKFHITAA